MEKLKAQPKKPLQIRKKIKTGTFISFAAAKRVVGGLTKGYQKVFVTPEEMKVNFHREQGFEHFTKGEYIKARDSFFSYIEKAHDRDASILYMLAMCYKNMGDLAEAADFLSQAEKIAKNDPDIIAELGNCLFSIEEYPEASVFLLKAVKTDPKDAELYYHLGICFEKTKEAEDAKKFYKKAIDLAPRRPEYHQALGFAYQATGHRKDAIACFRKALDMEWRLKKAGG